MTLLEILLQNSQTLTELLAILAKHGLEAFLIFVVLLIARRVAALAILVLAMVLVCMIIAFIEPILDKVWRIVAHWAAVAITMLN